MALVDDSERFVHAARAVLEADGLEVVGVASGSVDACRLVEELHPEVVLVDVQLGDENGVEVGDRLVNLAVAPAVVLMSARDADDLIELDGVDLASGFIPKAGLSGPAVLERVARQGSYRASR